MFNRYTKGSEPWFAMQDALSACQAIDDGKDDAEDVFERVIDELDTAISEKEEVEAALEKLEKEHEGIKATLEALHDINPEMITLLTNMKLAAEAMERYATVKLQELGALNATSPDSSSRDSGDGSSEADPDQNDGSQSPEGESGQ